MNSGLVNLSKYLKKSFLGIGWLFKKIWKWLAGIIVIGAVVTGGIFGYDAIKEYKEKKAEEKAVTHLEAKLSNSGNTDSIFQLSMKVLRNFRVSIDGEVAIPTPPFHSKAISNIKRLAEKGIVRAQYNLGLYYNGYDFRTRRFINSNVVDYEKSAYWYLQAANQGHGDAMNNLGVCYQGGKGVKHDPIKALHWYRKAYENGNGYGAMNLGDCFRDGVKVRDGWIWDKDPDCFYCTYKHRCDEHTYRAYKMILFANIDSAKYYWEIAVKRGCAAAKNQLQKIYE